MLGNPGLVEEISSDAKACNDWISRAIAGWARKLNLIRDSGLVFHRQKDEAMRCPRALPGNDASCYGNRSPSRLLPQVSSGIHPLAPEAGTVIHHRVWSRSKTCAAIVSSKPLLDIHLS